MELQSLWKIAIFSQPEVGHWPSDIGGTVGPSQQQLEFLFCSPRRMLHSDVYGVNALKNTCKGKFRLNLLGIQNICNFVTVDKKKMKIISQTDRPFVAQTTVLKLD